MRGMTDNRQATYNGIKIDHRARPLSWRRQSPTGGDRQGPGHSDGGRRSIGGTVTT
jgi:hypothetical protein